MQKSSAAIEIHSETLTVHAATSIKQPLLDCAIGISTCLILLSYPLKCMHTHRAQRSLTTIIALM